MSVVEAKARFAEAVRSAEAGEPVVIERHGEPVAGIVSAEDLRLLAQRRVTGERGTLLDLCRIRGLEDFALEVEEATLRRGPVRAGHGLE